MKLLSVRVISPDGEIGSYKARSVSSNNSAGRFDVLPGHANFVTYISGKKIEVVLENKLKVELDYPVGIMQVAKDNVSIFVDVETFKSL